MIELSYSDFVNKAVEEALEKQGKKRPGRVREQLVKWSGLISMFQSSFLLFYLLLMHGLVLSQGGPVPV